MTVEAARAGRPRSAACDAAILDAAAELLGEVGYDALSIEGVAARAGVGKTTIYRRYPTKVELVIAASEHMGAGVPPFVERADIRADLLAIAQAYVRMLTATDVGRAVPMMIVAKTQNPELARAHDAFVASRRAVSIGVIRRAIERGELPVDVDPELISDLLTGPIMLRVLVTGAPVTSQYLEQLVDSILS
ncbi:MAG: TetR/AcrR family transcriptional regulator [Acidimicrobiia bacterium]